MQKNILFNVGLLLEESFQKKLIDYSQQLLKVQPAFYSLGKESIPHVTLLQFHGDEEAASEIWEKIQFLSHSEIKLDFLGLHLDRWNRWNCFWVRVRKTRELEQLQAKAIQALQRNSFVNGVGERFDPHSTLLAWPEAPFFPPFPIGTEVMNQTQVQARLTLGKSGPNYQYAQCLRG
jgi:2'-5' RNA ligase